MRVAPIGLIGIDPLLDGAARQLQSLAPNRRLQRFQVEFFEGLASQQRFDVPQDLSGEQAAERGFF